MKQATPNFGTVHTKMIPEQKWVFIAMTYDNSGVATNFYYSNNVELVNIGTNTSVKFNQAIGLTNHVAQSYDITGA